MERWTTLSKRLESLFKLMFKNSISGLLSILFKEWLIYVYMFTHRL
jgi:hypothetical protein